MKTTRSTARSIYNLLGIALTLSVPQPRSRCKITSNYCKASYGYAAHTLKDTVLDYTIQKKKMLPTIINIIDHNLPLSLLISMF